MSSVNVPVLLVIGVVLGVGLPLVRRAERLRQRERADAAEHRRQRQMIADYEATITAYRRFVQDDPELSATAL